MDDVLMDRSLEDLLLGTLPELAAVLGPMPPGDTPAAWYASLDHDVRSAWDHYQHRSRDWWVAWDQLLALTGFPAHIQMATQGGDTLVGLIPPTGVSIPGGWRKTATGQLVPRRKTRGEKASAANALWAQLEDIPRPVLPGMPSVVWTEAKTYPVAFRKPAVAVCAFLGHDPDTADFSFVTGPQWTRLKISTFQLLRERQQAGG